MKRFRQKSGLVARNIGGELVIVPVEGNVGDMDSVYTLNEVGSTIWALLDGRTGLDRIVEAVCDRYEVTPEEARRDVTDLIGSLEAAGLIHPIDEE